MLATESGSKSRIQLDNNNNNSYNNNDNNMWLDDDSALFCSRLYVWIVRQVLILYKHISAKKARSFAINYINISLSKSYD